MAVLQVARQLPAYKVERIAKLGPVRRLMKLGDRLLMDDLDPQAKGNYEKELLALLDSQREGLVANGGGWAKRIKEAGLIDVRRRDVTVLADDPEIGLPGTAKKVKAVSANIEHAFAEAGRRLGEGLHRAYLKARARHLTNSDRNVDVSLIKREIWVLASDTDVLKALEDRANTLCEAELDKHETAINHLPDDKRAEYRAILREGAKPKAESWDAPDTVEGDKEGDPYDRHLYVKPDGTYTSARFTSLEKKTLAEELARDDVMAWLRNVERKSWAFSIYYDLPSGPKNMYPDFLVFRKDGQHIVCDVLEPHSQSQSDSVAKAKGLAVFADLHAPKFARIQLIDEVSGQLKRLDFKNPETRKRVKAVSSAEGLRQLFEDAL